MSRSTTSSLAVDPEIPVSEVMDAHGLDLSKAEDRDEVARQIEERVRMSLQAEAYLRSYLWPRSILYAHGEQDPRWNPTAGQWMVRKPGLARKYSANVLSARLQTWVAQMVQHRPNLTAVPLNDDQGAKQQAELGEHLFAYDWRALSMGDERWFATIDCGEIGMGILEYGWDHDGGDVVMRPMYQREENGQVARDKMNLPIPLLDGNGRQKFEPAVRAGGMFVRSRSPFSFVKPPGVEKPTLRGVPWVSTLDDMSEAKIRRCYGKSDERPGGLIEDDFVFASSSDPELDNIQNSSRFFQAWQRGYTTTSGPRGAGRHQVITYREEPSTVEGFEKGRVLAVCCGKLIGDYESALQKTGRYPFALFPWLPRPGFWPQSWIEAQCDPQARYNQTLSDAMTHLAIHSKPILLVPRNSNFPLQVSWNGSGYHYSPAMGEIKLLQAAPPNEAAQRMTERALTDLNLTSGQGPFSRGEPVPNVPSAAYASVMKDLDNSELGPVAAAHARAWESLGSGLIELHHFHDTEEKLIAVVGESNAAQMVAFKGSDLAPDLRFVVAESSMLSTLPAAQLEKVDRLMQSGLLVPKDQPVSAEMRRALLNYAQMPELVEVETGTRVVDKWIERTLGELIDHPDPTSPLTVSPLWKEEAVQALSDALDQRVLEPDARRWDAEVTQRVIDFRDQLTGYLNAMAKQHAQEAQAAGMAAIEPQLEIERTKAAGRIRQGVIKEAAKAGMDTIRAAAGDGEEKQEGEEAGEKPPPQEGGDGG